MRRWTWLLAALLLLAFVAYTQQSRSLEQPYNGLKDVKLGAAMEKLGLPSRTSKIEFDSDTLQADDVPSKCGKIARVADNLIIVALHKEEISWLITQVNVPFLAYQAYNESDSNLVRTHNNGAKEASAYLQFIAEYYDCLPEVTAFIHAHQKAWHSHDMVEDLQRLNWSSVPQMGYMPLHLDYFQPWGMYFSMELKDPSNHLQTIAAEGDPKAGEVINGTIYESGETYRYRQAQEIVYAWETFLEPAGLGPMPEKLQYYCCAQFLVTAERIQRLPREFYLKAIHWTANGKTLNYFKPGWGRGVVMESLWHYIFGEPAFMPKAPTTELCNHFSCKPETI